ncbi:MAG: ABC transporter permease subunit, partial [Planctomycetota bacterium]
ELLEVPAEVQDKPNAKALKVNGGVIRFDDVNFHYDANRPILKNVSFEVPAIVIAQFVVATAFAARAMRATFDELSGRREAVAMTLGCTRGQAFVRVTLPEAKRGLLSAFTLAWARCLGEFGPVLVFAGTTRFKTEVLPTSIFLQLNIGDLQGALAVALLMVTLAAVVLGATRWLGRSW